MVSSWKHLSEYQFTTETRGDVKLLQAQWLLDTVARNARTAYGKRYHFAEIKSVADYLDKLPVVSYQDISSDVEHISKGHADCLFAGNAIAFERTSGSTSKPKLIPYSSHSIADFREAILPWLVRLARRYQILSGKAYWAISPASRQPELTDAGIPVGLPDAAYLGEDLIPFFIDTSAVPPWLAELSDIRQWQLLTMYYLICCRDLKLISVWSPTFLLTLLDALDERREELTAILVSGAAISGHHLPPNKPAFACLQQYYLSRDWRVVWPELTVISCWCDASAQSYADILKAMFPGVLVQSKGLLLTEGIISVPDWHNQTVLAATSGFYEFHDEHNRIHLAHELTSGESYDVIMTTAGGLYRYRSADRVCCTGYVSGLPVLRFIGRKATSDIVGEKLTEEFVSTCLAGIAGFKMLIPMMTKRPGYALVVESNRPIHSIIYQVEQRLCENPQYAYARKLGQLQPLRIVPIKNPLQVFLNSPVHAGTRLGDIKVPSLYLNAAPFDSYLGNAA